MTWRMRTSTSTSRPGAAVVSRQAELRRHREFLVARAELERQALRETTQDLQLASDRMARIAIVGISLARRYWLPATILLAGSLFKRAQPVLRMARTGLAVWQTVKMLRASRR
jgi:hypothetical protein